MDPTQQMAQALMGQAPQNPVPGLPQNMLTVPPPSLAGVPEYQAVTPRSPERGLGWEGLQQDLADRASAMMQIQDPAARAAVQQKKINEELNEFSPHKQFDI